MLNITYSKQLNNYEHARVTINLASRKVDVELSRGKHLRSPQAQVYRNLRFKQKRFAKEYIYGHTYVDFELAETVSLTTDKELEDALWDKFGCKLIRIPEILYSEIFSDSRQRGSKQKIIIPKNAPSRKSLIECPICGNSTDCVPFIHKRCQEILRKKLGFKPNFQNWIQGLSDSRGRGSFQRSFKLL